MKQKVGFTLIELIVVVAIISILAGTGLVTLRSSQSRSRDNRRVADLKLIQTALELYYLDGERKESYPGGTTYPYPIYHRLSDNTMTGQQLYVNDNFLTFLPVVPKDPKNKDYIYFGPGCVRPGGGVSTDLTIISPARVPAGQSVALLNQTTISTADDGAYCPNGSGWVPYVLYALLERPRPANPTTVDQSRLVSLVDRDLAVVVYSSRTPLYKVAGQETVAQSYCVPANSPCLTGF